jgi:hypothetical protein
VLWGYELSPFVKVVQEVLSELELPYKQVRTSIPPHERLTMKNINITIRIAIIQPQAPCVAHHPCPCAAATLSPSPTCIIHTVND